MKLQTSGVFGTSYAIAKLAPKRGRSTSCDANLNAIADNLEFSMKIAMASFQNASKQVDKNTLKIINNDNIDKISTKINGGLIGKESRRKYSKNAYDEFNK